VCVCVQDFLYQLYNKLMKKRMIINYMIQYKCSNKVLWHKIRIFNIILIKF